MLAELSSFPVKMIIKLIDNVFHQLYTEYIKFNFAYDLYIDKDGAPFLFE